MSSLSIASIRVRLRHQQGRYQEICDLSGLSYSWLSKFACGERGKRPSFDFIQRLDKALALIEPTASKPASSND